MLHEVLDLLAVLPRHAVACRVGDVDDLRTGIDHGLNDLGQVFVLGAAGIFGIEFDLIDLVAGILDGSHGTFDDFLAGTVELVFDVAVAGADACMDSFMLCEFKGFGCAVNVLLYGACKGADCRPCDSLRDFYYGIEVAWTGNWESSFDDVNA